VTGLRYAALGVAIALAILAMIWPGWHPPAVAQRRVRALASYFVSLVLGIVVVLLAPLGHGDTVPFFATVALVAWVMLGALWLCRRYPGIPQPDWVLEPWSAADWGLIAVLILSSLATVLG
jgi:hypothetical protein